MSRGISLPDPFLLYDSNSFGVLGVSSNYRQTKGLTLRSATINPAIKTLVFLVGGQSLSSNVTPTLYLPTNSTMVDNFNIYDGAIYNINGPLLGSTYTLLTSLGPGNIATRIADTLVTNTKFNRVIIVSMSIGSTTASMWGDATGIHNNRVVVAMKRLAACGIVPGMTGVTFACLFDLGEQDLANGTSQAAMTASLNSFISTLQGTGFNGKIFIPLESGVSQTSNNCRSAQAAVWNGSTVFSGGDFDSIDASGRQPSDVHWNDSGAASAATLVINAMAASGPPF